MGKSSLRLWMIAAASLAGGSLALFGISVSLPARITFGVLSGVGSGLILYLYNRLDRPSAP